MFRIKICVWKSRLVSDYMTWGLPLCLHGPWNTVERQGLLNW